MREDIPIRAELEAEDSLAVKLIRLSMEFPATQESVKDALFRQTKAIIDNVTYMEGPLGLIEVDGISNAALIRSRNPVDGRYVQFILRGGRSILCEAVGGAVHLSRENYERLRQLLQSMAG